MENRKMKYILLSIMLTATTYGGDLSFQFLNIDKGRGSKNISTSYRPSDKFLAPKYVLGAFNDSNMQVIGDYRLRADVFMDFKVKSKGGLYLQAAQGVSYTAADPKELETRLQWPTQLEFGLINGEGFGVGIQWVHYSNGKARNKGREYLGLSITVPLTRKAN